MKSLREYALIALVLWLDTVSFAAYFFASRAYVRDSLGELEAYRYVALLVGFEGIASLAAPLGGVLGDVYGRRAVALLSLLRAPVYLSIPIVTAYDPRLLFVPAFVGGVFSNIFYSNALGVLLHRARGSGRVYATVTMVFPLAWSVGSVIPGLLEPLGGYTLIFSSVGATALLASLLLALLGDNNSSGARYRDALDSLSALPKSLLAGLLLAGAGLTLYWNLLSIKLYEVTESLLV
ncbi:MAG: MFS transporter, partial [Acidilobaceae archaeon]